MMRAVSVLSLASMASAGLVETVMPVPGLSCDGNQSAWVLYPNDNRRYPLVSFAHGLNAWDSPKWFPYLLRSIAESGYVVVASLAGTGWCSTESQDQIHCLDWAKKHPVLSSHINTVPGTGVVGHSMGGGATITSASNSAGVAAQNIKVAVAMHPAAGTPNAPKIPILYLTGSSDFVVSPSSVLQQYNAASGVYKSFANVKGATHTNAVGCPSGCEMTNPNSEDLYPLHMLDCFLKGDSSKCALVETCSVKHAVTGASLPVTECHHATRDSEALLV